MSAGVVFQCEWMGVSPNGDGRTLSCGRPARGHVVASNGRRINICAEHVGWGKRQGASGQYVHGTAPDDRAHPATYHASTVRSPGDLLAVGSA